MTLFRLRVRSVRASSKSLAANPSPFGRLDDGRGIKLIESLIRDMRDRRGLSVAGDVVKAGVGEDTGDISIISGPGAGASSVFPTLSRTGGDVAVRVGRLRSEDEAERPRDSTRSGERERDRERERDPP